MPKEGVVFDQGTPLVQGAPVENLLVVLRGNLAAWQEGAAEPLFHLKEGTACPHRLGAGKFPLKQIRAPVSRRETLASSERFGEKCSLINY
jgi:hypothetical protein